MYVSNARSDREAHARVGGLADDATEPQFRKSFAAIKAALDLNPRTGYVTGTPARRTLQGAFESVPPSLALQLAQHLLDNEGPLARLFRYRVHKATQRVMLMILARKAMESQQLEKDKLRRIEDETRRLDSALCTSLKNTDSLTEAICRQTGEASQECKNARAGAVRGREELRAAGVRCP